MTNDRDYDPKKIRRAAEERYARTSAASAIRPASEELVYELRVHQIELEMQHEQLRQAQEALEASRDRFVDLYEFAPNAYFTLTRDGLIAESNLKASTMLGVERKNLRQRRFARFVADQDQDRWYRLFQTMRENPGEQTHETDMVLVRNDGSTFGAHLDCLCKTAADESWTLRIALVDISRLKQAEDELRIAAIAFESQEGMMITDAQGVILKVNQAFSNITGFSAEEAIGRNFCMLQSECKQPETCTAMWKNVNATGFWSGEIWTTRKNGEDFAEQLTLSAVKNDEGVVTNFVAAINDNTLKRAAAEEIKRLAFYDYLTHLPNRRLLLDRINQAFATTARKHQRGALLFVDLDNFKDLNDNFGHDIGDLLLLQVAQRLVSCVREEDTVARIGGDEFVIMLEDLSPDILVCATQVEVIGEKILAALNQPYQLGTHEYHNSPSIGATLFSNHTESREDLLKQADIAMYQAKKTGRNTLRFFDPQMQAIITERMAMETDLRQALTRNQFVLHYQLQATHDGRIVGAEALIRWLRPGSTLVPPNAFIPLAEETGLILPIGQWVLEMACAQIKKWEDSEATRHLQLAINVSARRFHQPDFVEQVLAAVRNAAIDPSKLKLELTESVVLKDADDTIRIMNELDAHGIHFSMDDFGTGYSSLAYLTQLPFKQLKIAQSFVRNLGVRPADAVIAQTIIAMANTLEMAVIAEGVETEEQRAFLEQHGCPLCQGYLFGKPVPVEEFEALLKQD